MEDVADPLLGCVLDGRYEILEVAGRGGIGVVYRARQAAAGGRDVAVKVLIPAAVHAGASVLRFENEATIIASLKHPNTIKLFDTGRTEDGRFYIVTEFLEGETLLDRVTRGPLGDLAAANVMVQIARSLAEAHERGIVHRDLKLANIFLERVGGQEVVKVLDFGIAKLVDSQRLTAPLQVFGTPGYMSPEQARGEDVDARSDLFSLGVIGFVCLAARLPWHATDADGLVLETIAGPTRRLADVVVGRRVEPALEDLVTQLMATDPAERLPSAAATADAIENALRSIDTTAGLPVASVPKPPAHVPNVPPAAKLRDPQKGFLDSAADDEEPSDVRDTVTFAPPPEVEPDAIDTAADTERSTRLSGAVRRPRSQTMRNWMVAATVAVVVSLLVVAVLAWGSWF